MTGKSNNGEQKDGVPDGLAVVAPSALRLLLERTPVALWAVDREMRLIVTAGAGLMAIGLRPGEGVGFSLYEHFGKNDDGFPPVGAHLAALRGETTDFEHMWCGRLMAVRVAPLGPPGKPIEGAIGVAFDVTDQREHARAETKRDGERDGERGARLRDGDARRGEGVLRTLRPRLFELEQQLGTLQAVSERLAATVGAPVALGDIDQLRRASGRGIDVVRAMGEAITAGAEREVKPEPDRAGGETILLVDDEAQVRGFVRRALEDQGYRVLEASTVEEALSIGAAFEGRIHLLLTDVVLPGQNGPHLAARLAPVRPEMRILYMTGYADDAIVDRGVLSAGQSLLVKPFTSLGLAHGVKKALRS